MATSPGAPGCEALARKFGGPWEISLVKGVLTPLGEDQSEVKTFACVFFSPTFGPRSAEELRGLRQLLVPRLSEGKKKTARRMPGALLLDAKDSEGFRRLR